MQRLVRAGARGSSSTTSSASSIPAAAAQASAGELLPRASGGWQLNKMQLQAIHRFAAANGKAFSNVALEGVEADEGGVEKWCNVPQKVVEEMFKDNEDPVPPFAADSRQPLQKPRIFPIRKGRNRRGNVSKNHLYFC